VLDYGCGTGTATPYIIEILKASHVVGVDISESSLEVAREHHAGLPASYELISSYNPSESIDLAYCNGVFHHIPLAERLECARYVADCLRPGGLFALWENNPWNPGTRYVMSRIPFDRDAIMLSARTARKLVKDAGLRVVRTDYRFIFPKFLSALRKIEEVAVRLPFGAQYQVLCRKDN
jgi:SAM-dependent methyltransferase